MAVIGIIVFVSPHTLISFLEKKGFDTNLSKDVEIFLLFIFARAIQQLAVLAVLHIGYYR